MRQPLMPSDCRGAPGSRLMKSQRSSFVVSRCLLSVDHNVIYQWRNCIIINSHKRVRTQPTLCHPKPRVKYFGIGQSPEQKKIKGSEGDGRSQRKTSLGDQKAEQGGRSKAGVKARISVELLEVQSGGTIGGRATPMTPLLSLSSDYLKPEKKKLRLRLIVFVEFLLHS
ncbi:uncharacterized protein LOC120528547 [Polypterus senegalus]|uniref:uncharacterized protein LOC120528547 n=1 Tax=Polypterus senegalus TaxID=55291 RepID=UPI001965DF16|nr:uncharacterized protein LOC120528547 [Polypterus senegalus]